MTTWTEAWAELKAMVFNVALVGPVVVLQCRFRYGALECRNRVVVDHGVSLSVTSRINAKRKRRRTKDLNRIQHFISFPLHSPPFFHIRKSRCKQEKPLFEKIFYSSHQKPIRKIAHAMAMTFSPSRPPRIIISSHFVSIASKSGTKDIRGAREKRGNRSEEEGNLAETAGLSLGFEQAEDVVDLDCCGDSS